MSVPALGKGLKSRKERPRADAREAKASGCWPPGL